MKTLVFVHGYLGSALNWTPVLHKLQKEASLSEWNFLAVDLLWHGRRRGPEDAALLTLDSMVDDLAVQLQAHPTFFALGHSFGLRPILRFAQRQPARVLGIVAEDSTPEISNAGAQQLHEVLGKTPTPFTSREAAKAYLDQSFGAGTPLSRFLLSNIREQSPAQHSWRFQAHALEAILNEAIQNPLWKEWSNFTGPIHMITGAQTSSYINPARLKHCFESRVGKETFHESIEQAGHWVHSDQPEAFVQSLVKILKLFE